MQLVQLLVRLLNTEHQNSHASTACFKLLRREFWIESRADGRHFAATHGRSKGLAHVDERAVDQLAEVERLAAVRALAAAGQPAGDARAADDLRAARHQLGRGGAGQADQALEDLPGSRPGAGARSEHRRSEHLGGTRLSGMSMYRQGELMPVMARQARWMASERSHPSALDPRTRAAGSLGHHRVPLVVGRLWSGGWAGCFGWSCAQQVAPLRVPDAILNFFKKKITGRWNCWGSCMCNCRKLDFTQFGWLLPFFIMLHAL